MHQNDDSKKINDIKTDINLQKKKKVSPTVIKNVDVSKDFYHF